MNSKTYFYITFFSLALFATLFNTTFSSSSFTPQKNLRKFLIPNGKEDANSKEKNLNSIGFIPNRGQWDFPALYWSRKGNIDCFVEKNGWTLDLKATPRFKPKNRFFCHPGPNSNNLHHKRKKPSTVPGVALKFSFLGSNPFCKLCPGHPYPGYFNFILGKEQERWRTRVKSYQSILFKNLYDGIDMELMWGRKGIVYDFRVQPGVDLKNVRIQVLGAKKIELSDHKTLLFHTDLGVVSQPPIQAWTLSPGNQKRKVSCSIKITGENSFCFLSENRETKFPLYLDPDLFYSSFLGGAFGDLLGGAVHVSGDTYIIEGWSESPNFPTTPGAYSRKINLNGSPPTTPPTGDVVLLKMDLSLPGKNALIWATFFGGSKGESPSNLGIGPKGNPIFSGITNSPDLPTTKGAWDRILGSNGSPNQNDAFIAKISKDGTTLLASTFLGGSRGENQALMALLPNGLVALSCSTDSFFDFPVTAGNMWKKSYSTLTILDPPFRNLLFSTFWEPSSSILTIKADSQGNLFLSGRAGKEYPTTQGVIRNNPLGPMDWFVSKFSFTKRKFLWSTFLGLRTEDWVQNIALGPKKNVYILGLAFFDKFAHPPIPFPTTRHAYDRGPVGYLNDCFVMKISKDGSKVLFSTLLGFDPNLFWTWPIKVNSLGQAVLCGRFMSQPNLNLFTPDAILNERNKKYPLGYKCFSLRLGESGSRLLYFSILGGYKPSQSVYTDGFWSETLVGDFTAIFLGSAAGSDFPTTPNSYSPFPISAGSAYTDGVIVKMSLKPSGVRRYGTWSWSPLGAPTCYVTADPKEGENYFGFACWKAPKNSSGALLIGRKPLAQGIQVLGITLWVDPASSFFALPVTSDKDGRARIQLPLPKGTKGARFAAQFVWKNGGSSQFSASDALEVTVQ